MGATFGISAGAKRQCSGSKLRPALAKRQWFALLEAGTLVRIQADPIEPASSRMEAARLVEDLTASHTGGWMSLISLHGGGSPEAMKREIWRNYPVGEKAAMVEKLLDRGILDEGQRVSKQPGRCFAPGCEVPKVARVEDAAE